jgi:hypothetical protein
MHYSGLSHSSTWYSSTEKIRPKKDIYIYIYDTEYTIHTSSTVRNTSILIQESNISLRKPCFSVSTLLHKSFFSRAIFLLAAILTFLSQQSIIWVAPPALSTLRTQQPVAADWSEETRHSNNNRKPNGLLGIPSLACWHSKCRPTLPSCHRGQSLGSL